MKVHVRLFAILRERAGRSELPLELPDRATVADAIGLLSEQLPEIRPHLRSIAFAVNRAYASGATVLQDGDELALIPPVSGG
jgi:molybdopterin converting factor subunit 1